jgi:hypothetical protein
MVALTRLVTTSACSVVIAATTFATVARADDPQRVAIVATGPDGDAIASGIASHLSAPYGSDSDGFRSALGAGGARLLPLAAKRHDKDAELVKRARAAARSAHVDKAILVHVERSRKATVVHVWVIEPQGSGSAPIDQDVRLGAGATAGDETDAAWNAVASEFPAKASPAPVVDDSTKTSPPVSKATDEPTAKAPDDEAPSASSGEHSPSEHTRANAFAVLGAAMQGGSRHFSYVDRLTPTLRPYDLSVAPLFAIHGEIYPFSNTSIPVISGLGAIGDYARAFGLGSEDSAGNQVGTSWQAFDLGLRERLLLGRSFILGVDLGYGDDNFAFDSPVTPTAQLPSTNYEIFRGGLDGRFVHDKLSVQASASYLAVLSTGEFGTVFPRTSVGGVEASVGASYTVAPSLEATLALVYTRFFYDLQPVPGDSYVAGGALDQMATVSLGLAYLF